MLYFKIIFNTLLDIIFFQDILSLLFFLLSSFYLYFLYKSIINKKNSIKFLILFSRFIIILLILPIIKNNIHRFEEIKLRPQNIGVLFDNSLSSSKILENDNSVDIYKTMDLIRDWGNTYDINLFWYNLSSGLNSPYEILFDQSNTSYDYLSEILNNAHLDQLLLISDGNVNSGLLSNNFYSNQSVKIHSIGMGEISDYKEDIGIIDLNIDNSDDSLYVKTTFSVNINNRESESIIYNIYSQSNQIYSDTLRFINGTYNFDKNTVLDLKLMTKNLNLEILPLTYFDDKGYNNSWHVNIPNEEKNNLLLITGKLNYNTSFLKNNILSIPNTTLEHYVVFNDKFNYSNIQLNKFDCVIMDNFPNNSVELDLFSKLVSLEKRVLFFEGYDFEANFLIDMLEIAFPNQFYIENINISKKFKLNNEFDIGFINSSYNLFSKNNFIHKKELFSNQSIAQFSSPNLSFFLIPKISEISFFMQSKYNSNYVSDYINYFIHKGLKTHSLVNLELKKNNYLIGEKLLFKLDNNISVDISSAQVIINNLTSMNIDTLDYYSDMNFFLKQKGDFEIYFIFNGTNSSPVNSNKEFFTVNKDNIELEKISQNIDLLMSLSSKSNGLYSDINNFNGSFLESLELTPIKKKYQHIYTPLDIFIERYIFILVIVFFCVEIFLRKKVGLL